MYQVVQKQYAKKKAQLISSQQFKFTKEEAIYIPTDFSAIKGWFVHLIGNTMVCMHIYVLMC